MTTVATIAAELILNAKDYIAGIKESSDATEKFWRDADGRLRDVQGRFVPLGHAAQDFGTKMNHLGDQMVKTGGLMTASLTLPIVAFGAASVKAAQESEAAIANLESTIASTGNKTGITSKEFQDMATALQNMSGYSDEAILDAETMLLTFDQIGKEAMPRATEATLDLARRFGMDLHQASIMLGKALNDPATGLGALSRVGVSFTEQQKQMVEQMMAVGDVAGAQAVIFDAVEAQVKGAAEAYGKTAAGQMDIFREKLGGLQEVLGAAIIPSLVRFIDALTPIIEGLASAPPFVIDFIVAMMAFVAASGPIITALGFVAKAIAFFSAGGGGAAIVAWITGTLIPALGSIATFIGATLIPAILPILPLLALIAAAVALVWLVWKNWDTLSVTISQLWAIIKHYFQEGINAITQYIKDGVSAAGEAWNGMKEKASQVWEGIKSAFQSFVDRMRSGIQNIRNAFQQGFQFILSVAMRVFAPIISAIMKVIGAVMRLRAALGSIKLPAALTPGSPTPFEMGLRGIGSAMDNLNKKSIPQMNAGINSAPNMSGVTSSKSTYIDNRKFSGGMNADELRVALDKKMLQLVG